MIGTYAFCHRSGAPLSDQEYYDENGKAWRSALSVDGDDQLEGSLTNGKVRSTPRALVTYFRRSHRRHHEFDAELYNRAALAVRRLKRTATGDQEPDRHVWYALKYRLDQLGYESEWMFAHAGFRCPRCQGRLVFERSESGTVRAYCGTSCCVAPDDPLVAIREAVASLYAAAFDEESPDPDQLLEF